VRSGENIKNSELGNNLPPINFNETDEVSSAIPKIGEIKKGFAFKGGNPADKNNWIKATK
jgi:hypothetical protein